MSGGLVKITVSMGLAVLFAFAIISYVTNFANDNNVAIDAGEDAELLSVKSGIETGVDTIVIGANESTAVLQESEIKSGDENVEGGGQFKVEPYNVFTIIKDIIQLGNKKIFGGDVNFLVFTAALSAFMAFIIGLYIWKAWKGGLVD